MQVPEGQGAVQQGQCGFIIGELFHGVGQALHLPHGAQRAEQGAGDQGFAARAVGRTEVQILVRHGQGRLAEQLAAVADAVGDGAAAQVDEVAAQGQVAVHVDVGAVHGQRGPVLGNLGRRPAAQQALGPGAGGDVGTAAHRGGAEGSLAGGHGERPVDGVVQTPAAAPDVRGHAVQCGQQLICGEAQVQRHADW